MDILKKKLDKMNRMQLRYICMRVFDQIDFTKLKTEKDMVNFLLKPLKIKYAIDRMDKLEPTKTLDNRIKEKCWNSKTKSLFDGFFYKIDILSKNIENVKENIDCYLKKFNKESKIFKDIFKHKITKADINKIKDGNYTYVLIEVKDIVYLIISPIISELEISSKHLCLPLLLKDLLPIQENGRYYNLYVYSAGNLLKNKDGITIDFYSGSFFTIVMDVYELDKKEDLRTENKQKDYFNNIKLSFFKKNVNINFSFEELNVLNAFSKQELINLIECGFIVHRSKGKIDKKGKHVYDTNNEEHVTLDLIKK